jgi:RNA recognition motif-containing protein
MAPVTNRQRKRERSEDQYEEGSGKSKLAKLEADAERSRRMVVVRQLTTKVTETTIEQFFGQIGEVADVAMPRNDKGKHRGIAYVEMKESANVPNCILLNDSVPDFQKFPILVEAVNGDGGSGSGSGSSSHAHANTHTNPVANAAAFVAALPPPPAAAATPLLVTKGSTVPTKVLIRNIRGDIDNGEFLEVLRYYGPVSQLHFQRSADTNIAFVTFAGADGASGARDALHKFELGGLHLEVSLVAAA